MDENPHVPLEPYPCNKIVYRAALFPDWIQRHKPPGKQISKQAFFLFEGQRGVSVAPSPENCIDGLTEPTYGVIAIKVGWIRDAGYDVVPDSLTHGNIIGLPYRTEDFKIASTGEANKIAAIARPYGPPASLPDST